MKTTFALKVVGKAQYVVIPDCEEKNVILCHEANMYSLWVFEESLVKSTERPHLFLSIQDGKLCLGNQKAQAFAINNQETLHLIENSEGCIIQSPDISKTRLTFELVQMDLPKPATSCHLRYGPELPFEPCEAKQWNLECTVQVERSAPCTYFCVSGFGPGGYCGIQEQQQKGSRNAIFSMWNEKKFSVECIERGEHVQVSKFGGEGTGIKTMKELYWTEGQRVTFFINAFLLDGYWFCECFYSLDNGSKHLMAVLKRSAQAGNPLNKTGFYSFIEDWDRCKDAQGFKWKRKAKFLGAKFNGIELNEALFTKVESGSDEFASDLAKGFSCPGGFALQTGTDVCANNTVLKST